MGRKSTFDRERALQSALKCFWLDGFDKTSLDDLLRSMGIRTSSFYHTFQSKEALFLEALHYYRQQIGARRIGVLRNESMPGHLALENFFRLLIMDQHPLGYPSGCFMMKTAAGLIDPASTVGREVNQAIRNLEGAFVAALSRAIASGHFKADLDVRSSAGLLLAQGYGISVLIRANQDKREVLKSALSLIEHFQAAPQGLRFDRELAPELGS